MVKLLVFFIVIGGVLILFQTLFSIQNPNPSTDSASPSNSPHPGTSGAPPQPIPFGPVPQRGPVVSI